MDVRLQRSRLYDLERRRLHDISIDLWTTLMLGEGLA